MPSHPVPELRRSHSGEEPTASAPVVESIAFSSQPSPAAAASGRAAGAFLCPHCGGAVIGTGDETFNDDAQCVIVNGARRHLGPVAWAILAMLRRHKGQFVSLRRIEDHVWSDRYEPPSVNLARVHICAIRKALVGSPYRIVNEYYTGYRLERFA